MEFLLLPVFAVFAYLAERNKAKCLATPYGVLRRKYKDLAWTFGSLAAAVAFCFIVSYASG